MNNPVCLSYLFIKLANDILDIASYNRDKFTLSVTLVSKEIVKTLVMTRKNYHRKPRRRCLCQRYDFGTFQTEL